MSAVGPESSTPLPSVYINEIVNKIVSLEAAKVREKIKNAFPEGEKSELTNTALSTMIADALAYYKENTKDYADFDFQATVALVAGVAAHHFMEDFELAVKDNVEALPETDEYIKALIEREPGFLIDIKDEREQLRTVSHYAQQVRAKLKPYLSKALKEEYEKQHKTILERLWSLLDYIDG